MSDTIYTLDARDNITLDLLSSAFGIDKPAMHNVINTDFKQCVEMLKDLEVNYEDLKNALIPAGNKKEIVFVFDSTKTGSASYGYPIMEKFISLFDKKSSHSVLIGDYIDRGNYNQELKEEFLNHIQTSKNIHYQSADQFYLVYINNLAESTALSFDQELSADEAYAGYFDLTYSSWLKTYLSTILIRAYIKSKNNIIAAGEFSEKEIPLNFPFKNYGFRTIGIQAHHYGLFLSYKIERKTFKEIEDDVSFSISAISVDTLDLSTFDIIIEELKLQYLKENKTDNLMRAGFLNLDRDTLSQRIREKILSNYLYNLCVLPEHGTIKFNVMIETERADTKKPMKLLVALEYISNQKQLRLLTMY